jgi:hypothetical protein
VDPPSENSGLEVWTVGATRPAPPAPVEPPRRRRRFALVAAFTVLAVLGLGGGVAAAVLRGDPPPPPPDSPRRQPVVYYLQVTPTSPQPGVVRLDFADARGLPGFDSYIVFRDGQPFDQVATGVPPYVVTTQDRSTGFCYQVGALLDTDQTLPALSVAPACKAADGKPVESS